MKDIFNRVKRMKTNEKRERLSHDNIWIISRGRYADLDLIGMNGGAIKGPVKEYRISDLARYLLNPNPIEVRKKLIGYEIHYGQQSHSMAWGKIRRILLGKQKEGPIAPEVLIKDHASESPKSKDQKFQAHIDKIYTLLRPHDPLLKKLSRIDRCKISDIVGICKEDIDGNHSRLTLKGGIDEKMNYISSFIGENVGVILNKASVADNLFEMRGFDFTSYNPTNSHRLVKVLKEGKPESCVLRPDGSVEYWIDDITLVHYMHLLEQSIKANPKFNESLNLCTEGNAKPLRLFFNKQLAIDYSTTRLPEVYKELLKAHSMRLSERATFMESLKRLQFGILFQYVPQSNSITEILLTNLSVMHDLRALEPIKHNLPQLYSEINKRAYSSEIGKFYLLDSIRGIQN